MKKSLFVTGMSRSGTTLLQKMLDAHPTMEILPQPFPFVFRQVKKDFFEFKGISPSRYVLHDLFNETRYSSMEFADFIKDYSMSQPKLRDVFDEMKDWSGQQVKPKNLEFLTRTSQGTGFEKIYAGLLQGMKSSNKAGIIGSKEILTEEFVGYMLSKQVKVILIYRDPRDVLTSINFGKGTHYVGDYRPTLFHLRNWRKSVAIRNTFLSNPNFLSFSYEKLTNDHDSVLEEVCRFLEIDNFPDSGLFGSKIPVVDGQWQGNSSQDSKSGVNESSVGRYRQLLPTDMIRYTEYICYPEMKSLGYSIDEEILDQNYNPSSFKEPFEIDSELSDIASDFSMSDSQLGLEKERFRLLSQLDSTQEEIERFFYSIENYATLSQSLRQ
jgi:hypothetical protein